MNKLKNKQVFLDLSENWVHRTNDCSPKWKEELGRYNSVEQKPPWNYFQGRKIWAVIGELLDVQCLKDFPGGSDGKASVYNVGDPGSIPGLGIFPREGNGNPLQYSCLENPMDGGAWCPWGRKESDTTERLRFTHSSFNNPKYICEFEEHFYVPAASPFGRMSSISLLPAAWRSTFFYWS